MATQEREFIGRHGQRIVYDVHEPQGSPRGVVIVAHGLGEHGGRYGHVADRLVGAGYRVAIPDHLGHGRSGGKRLRVNGFDDFTGDLEQVRAAVVVDGTPTFLLGHSMGGAIALDYALDHQDVLDGLVLSAAAVVPGDDLSAAAIRFAKIAGKIAPGLPTTAVNAASISRDPDVVAAYDADPLVSRGRIPAGLGAAMLNAMAGFPDRLPSLRIPTLVLHGSADLLTDPRGSELVARLAASDDLTHTVYDGLYHEIFNEPEKETVLDELVEWLQTRTPAATG
ncbi:alpha/beta hydrolase [Gordonia soli]|uniref:Monoacylglycerol lipase n=1 Tax=Gordonia soli NBRC 108243 TaxID=1223545 RepID=M0QQG0_9ACTN|nr:alpha/beta hydrolase [Gordonia soli]GAC70900.1 putative monoacylglycerol lipase [Gordonia soli NBRC 108243]